MGAISVLRSLPFKSLSGITICHQAQDLSVLPLEIIKKRYHGFRKYNPKHILRFVLLSKLFLRSRIIRTKHTVTSWQNFKFHTFEVLRAIPECRVQNKLFLLYVHLTSPVLLFTVPIGSFRQYNTTCICCLTESGLFYLMCIKKLNGETLMRRFCPF